MRLVQQLALAQSLIKQETLDKQEILARNEIITVRKYFIRGGSSQKTQKVHSRITNPRLFIQSHQRRGAKRRPLADVRGNRSPTVSIRARTRIPKSAARVPGLRRSVARLLGCL